MSDGALSIAVAALQTLPSPLGEVSEIAGRYAAWWQANRALLRELGVPGAELPGEPTSAHWSWWKPPSAVREQEA